VGEIIDENFTLLGLLGKGGMGIVYRSLQHSMEREVALKLLHPSFSDDELAVSRFLREAKQASKLNHPNVITLFDFGQSEKAELYLVMELLQGDTLAHLIEKTGPMPAQRAVPMISQLCDALHYAHEMGVVHRDLKPDNIYVIKGAGQTGEFVKVLDFGLAKIRGGDAGQTLTKEGIVCGTPAYMSPEQAMSRLVDRRSDIYSIGIMFYELLAGVPPFSGSSPLELLMAHVHDEPVPIREAKPSVEVPQSIDAVLMQALSKKPDNRPQTALELKESLQAALRHHERHPKSVILQPLDSTVGIQDSPTSLNISAEIAGAGIPKKPWLTGGRWITASLLVATAVAIGLFFTSTGPSTPKLPPSPESQSSKAATEQNPQAAQGGAAPAPVQAKPNKKTTPGSEENKPTLGSEKADSKPTATPQNPTETAETTLSGPVQIQSTPAGARLIVDGVDRGACPVGIARPEGQATAKIRLELDGFRPFETRIDKDSPRELNLTMTRKPVPVKPRHTRKKRRPKKKPVIIE